jgi:hypothetical protein
VRSRQADFATLSRVKSPVDKQSSTQSSSEAQPLAEREQVMRGTSTLSTPRAAVQTGRRWRRASRWIGLVIFLIGAALLFWTFSQAVNGFSRFNNPAALQQQASQLIGNSAAQIKDQSRLITAYISVAGGEALRFLYLLLLGLLGSLVAARGIQFFAASESVIDEAVESGMEENI